MANFVGQGQAPSPPRNLPDPPPQSGEIGAIAYRHGSGGSRDRAYEGTALQLREGLYNYGDLNGLHDSISSLKVMPGWAVRVFKDVDGGVPRGRSETIVGPAEIPELRNDRRTSGLENEISALKVYRVDGTAGGGTGGRGQQPPTDPPVQTPPIGRPTIPGPDFPTLPAPTPNPPTNPTNLPRRQPPLRPPASGANQAGVSNSTLLALGAVGIAATYYVMNR